MKLSSPRASAFLVAAAQAIITTANPLQKQEEQEGQQQQSLPPLLQHPQHQQQQHPLQQQRNAQQQDTTTNNNPPAPIASWYPNWAGGTNICLSHSIHPVPHYMSQQNLMKATMQICCDSYYWWDLEHCLGGSDVVVDVVLAESDIDGGSKEWYADYKDFKCVQDCPITTATTEYRCGGLLVGSSPASTTTTTVNKTSSTIPTTQGTHSTASTCCKSKFPYLALGLCVASSESLDEGNTNYEGSGEYYVDYGHGRCVQDCTPPTAADNADPSTITPPSTTKPGICGGIIMDSSTKLHTNPSDCCSTQLSYMDAILCETRSEEGGAEEGTFRLYPHLNSGTCVIDHNPSNALICSIGYTCQLLRPTAWVSKMYRVSPAGVEECCSEGLSYVNPSYCKAKTMGIVSRKWFVEYAEKLCHQDCEVGSGPSCAINNDPAVTYYDTPQQCCQSKLGYRNQNKCLSDSTGDPYEGTSNYYVDYKNSKCAQDCLLEENANGNCGGVVEDASTKLHGDAGSCCAASLGYMNLELCEDRSDSLATGTGKYYPSGNNDSFCVKDTSATPCPSGETCRRVAGWLSTLYETITECCESEDAALPANVTPAYCQALSTGAGTDKWFKHEDGDRCAKHCTTTTTANTATEAASCGIPSDASSPYYDTTQECCTAELDYLNMETCTELSEKGGILSDLVGTDEYYVDWIRQKCVKNCPVGSAVGCGGIAGGNWVGLHPDVDACCGDLHYVDRNDCVASDSTT